MRRSTRSAKPKRSFQEIDGAGSSDGQGSLDDWDDRDSSADEWQPEKRGKKGRSKARRMLSDTPSDEDEVSLGDPNDEGMLSHEQRGEAASSTGLQRKASRRGRASAHKAARKASVVADEDILAAQAAIDEEEQREHEAAHQEAEDMWKQVRQRKQGVTSSSPTASQRPHPEAAPPASLTAWLGIPEPDWPTTCSDAMINDRDSLFVGHVYSLSAPSLATIAQLLSHLSKTVHPQTIPTDRLPPALQHVASHRRGASHDMHAWRCLALKTGRSGLNGPEDFGLEEGMEDDGERFGAKEIAKVIKQLGATDVLVVVSRWYGGIMLGPVRFQHIESCARAALSQYMVEEALVPLRQQLVQLDDQVSALRLRLGASTPVIKVKYDNLDLDKAQRLIVARSKVIEMLEKRIEATQAAKELPPTSPTEGIAHVPTPPVQESTTSAMEEAAGQNREGQGQEQAAVKEEDDVDLTGWDALG